MTITPDQVMLWAHQQAVRSKSKRADYKFIPKRTDKNQPQIVKDFQTLGIQVTRLSSMGEGVFDLLCAYHWLVVSVEVKNGSKSASQREFTPAQEQWNKWWNGLRAVAINTADVVCIAEDMKRIVRDIHNAGMSPCVTGNREAQYQP